VIHQRGIQTKLDIWSTVFPILMNIPIVKRTIGSKIEESVRKKWSVDRQV